MTRAGEEVQKKGREEWERRCECLKSTGVVPCRVGVPGWGCPGHLLAVIRIRKAKMAQDDGGGRGQEEEIAQEAEDCASTHLGGAL